MFVKILISIIQTSKDPLIREASSHIDTEPIESKITKLEPVQQENENKKDI